MGKTENGKSGGNAQVGFKRLGSQKGGQPLTLQQALQQQLLEVSRKI